MIVRSTQPRPSQQHRAADRAVAFATTASRRSSSLDAAAQKSTTTPVRSSMVIANPNRSTRRWGTVQVRETDTTRNERVAAREAGEARQSSLAIRAAQAVHPAGDARTAGARSTGTRPERRVGLLPAERTATASASVGSAGLLRTREASRSNVVAMRSVPSVHSTHAGTRSTVNPKRSGAISASTTSTTSNVFANAGTRSSNAAKSRGALHVATLVGSEDFETVGATALAPAKREARKSSTRPVKTESKAANLRVARPQRRVARRTIARPASAVFAILLLVAGAVSAIVMHADLAKSQLVLDKVRVAVGTEERTNQRLRVEIAELESPVRIITAANQIGLVSAERVDYTTLRVSAPSK
jgi:cell division protein FtsL